MAYTVPYLCALLPFPAPSQAINALTSSSASSISPLRHRTNHTSHSFKTLQDEAAATPSHLLGFCGRKCFPLQDSYVAFIHTPAPRPAGVRGAGIKISFSADHLSKFSCGFMRKHEDMSSLQREAQNSSFASGSAEVVGPKVPTQAQSVVEGSGAVLVSEYKPIPDIDYLQELLAIQQQGPRAIGFFGTRNMGFMHQQLIEILSYAMVITKNHIYTSGASGTNAAVIRGALRAEKPELLTVILPQSLQKQPPESQELLAKVKNLFEKPQNDHLPLLEASRLCNKDILSHVQQVICFAFHDSRLLMETCQEAKNLRKIVTLFYLD